jgi:hypothetical protein
MDNIDGEPYTTIVFVKEHMEIARYWASLNGLDEKVVLAIYGILMNDTVKALTLQLMDGNNYRFVLLECKTEAHHCEFHDPPESRMQWQHRTTYFRPYI